MEKRTLSRNLLRNLLCIVLVAAMLMGLAPFARGQEASPAATEGAVAETMAFEDFFKGIQGITAENKKNGTENPYGVFAFEPSKDGESDVLVSTNDDEDESESAMLITADSNLRLSFQYKVSAEENGDALIFTKNDEVLKSISGEVDWTAYFIDLQAGDKVVIKYAKDYWGGENFDAAYLKDFKAEVRHSVVFEKSEAVGITVKAEDGRDVNAEADGTYFLSDGKYTYQASAYGYVAARGEFQVAGKDLTVPVPALSAKPLYDITIAVTPEDAKTELKHAVQGLIQPENGVYRLPEGEAFTYTVSKEDHITAEGSFTADKNKTIAVKLAYSGKGWDGSTKTEPENKEGIYLIGNAEELAWFAQEADKSPDISAKLTDNINLNGKAWTAFGQYQWDDEKSGFAGILDGDGKIVSGLTGGGLVDCLGPSGSLKNLTVYGQIEGDGNLGGIANTSKGTVENCAFIGKISTSASGASAGGIVGRGLSGNVIKNSYAAAQIENSCTYFMSDLNTGGIAGYTYGDIDSCYFTGKVFAREDRTNKNIGGIAGKLDGTIKNTYMAGLVTGPEKGIGAVVGKQTGVVGNTYYLEGSAPRASAESTGSGNAQSMTAGDMKTAKFAHDLGGAFNEDSDNINSGFPVLKWQGGKAPEVEDYQPQVTADKNAIVMKDAKRAEELKNEKQVVDKEVEDLGGIEYMRDVFDNPNLTIEDVYRNYGIDLDNDGTLKSDTNGKYQVKEEMVLSLENQGANGTAISWKSSDDGIINPKSGKISLPEKDKADVILTATVSKGNISEDRAFNFTVWSKAAMDQETLENLKAEIEKTSTNIQPMQKYAQTNVKQAMEQYLIRKGHDDIKVEFLSAGNKVLPSDNKTYIDDQGKITYFTGTGTGYGVTYAIYNDVAFKLSLNGQSEEVAVRVHIGWDFDYVAKLLDEVADTIDWNLIKADNENTASVQDINGWPRTVVDGKVTGDLTLPYAIEGKTYASIKWSADDMDALYVTDNGDGLTYNATLNRPAKGMADNDFELRAFVTFNFWDEYTKAEMSTQEGSFTDPVESKKLFRITIPANDKDQSEEITKAMEKYPELLREFVDKEKPVDTEAVTADMQMPRPQTLVEAGIMPDRYNQKVTMTSKNETLLVFNGYHAEVYRPLPGEADQEAEYTVRISDRRNNATLAEKTFKIKIKALEQADIDAAAQWMNQICTEEAYWNGIKGKNTDRNNITENLESFVEILNHDNAPEYVRGMDNITFGGVEVDDLPGYDPMHNQPWREFRSSRNSIITCENLLLIKPEYNTKVTIDSVLTHSEYGKYWKKFGESDAEKYAAFEQFYKRPVATTVTVKGEKDMFDPDAETPIKVSVNVDGKGFEGFKNLTGFNYEAKAFEEKTAWDALEACLIASGYQVKGGGNYVSAVTDSQGVTLEELEHGTYSGWMYTVNGELPEKTLGQMLLKDGDVINFYYSDGKEIENSEAAAEVETLINDLPAPDQLTLDDAQKVTEARERYNALTDEQKALVKNVSILENAEQTIQTLTLQAHRDEAKAQLEDYKNLTDYREAQQAELQKLIEKGKNAIDQAADTEAVDKALAEAKAAMDEVKTDAELTAEETQQAAQAVVDKIAGLGEITDLNQKAAVDEAQKAYDALTDAQKALVTNADVLKAAQDKLAELEKAEADQQAAQAVVDKIAGLGEITDLNQKAAVDEAQKAYDALTDAQKALVTNADVLKAAQDKLAKLEQSQHPESKPTQAPESGSGSEGGLAPQINTVSDSADTGIFGNAYVNGIAVLLLAAAGIGVVVIIKRRKRD